MPDKVLMKFPQVSLLSLAFILRMVRSMLASFVMVLLGVKVKSSKPSRNLAATVVHC